MFSAARLRPDPTITPIWRWESGLRGCRPGDLRRRRPCRRRGKGRRLGFLRPYCPTTRSLVLLPALIAGEDVAEREVDRLGHGLGGCQLRGCRLPYPHGVGSQLLRGIRRNLGKDRLSFLSSFEDQRSCTGLGLRSASFLLRVFHGCVPFLVGAVPCSRHGSAGDLLTALNRKTASGITRDGHDLSPQPLGVLGLRNKRELAVPIVDNLDVLGSGRSRRRWDQLSPESLRIGHEGQPQLLGDPLADRHPFLFQVGDGRRGTLSLRRRDLVDLKAGARVRPFPRLQLGDQVRWDPPSPLRQLTSQPIRHEAFESTDISRDEVGRRQGVRIGLRGLLGFELPLMLPRGIYAAIFFGDLSDGPIGGLQPGFGLGAHSDRVPPVQALRDLAPKRDVIALAMGRLHGDEHLAGQLVMKALADYDGSEIGQGQFRIDELIFGCLLADDGIQPLDAVVLLAQAGKRFLPPVGQPPYPGLLFDRQLEVGEGLKPCHAIPTLWPRSGKQLLQGHRAVRLNMFAQKTVDHGESLGANFRLARQGIFELRPGPQLARDNFLGPPAHLVLDVSGVDSDVVTIDVDASDVDMDVGVIGVVMIDGGPDETPPEVVFDLVHQPAGEFFQVELIPIFGGNDESKLPLLTGQRGTKGIPIEPILRSVKTSRRAVSFDAVGFQLRDGAPHSREALLSERCVPALDDASPTAFSRRMNRHAGRAGGLSRESPKSTPERRHTIRVTSAPTDAGAKPLLGIAEIPGAHRPGPFPLSLTPTAPEPGRGGTRSPVGGKTSPLNLRPALNFLPAPRSKSLYNFSARCTDSGVGGCDGRKRHHSSV